MASNTFLNFSLFCTEAIGTQRASLWEISVPTVLSLLTLFTALVGVHFYNKLYSNESKKSQYVTLKTGGPLHTTEAFDSSGEYISHVLQDEENFFDDFDREVLHSLKYYMNAPNEIAYMCVPALVSLVVSSVGLLFADAMIQCLWPVVGRPNINNCIQCFVVPVGFVYALSFGFMFQQTLDRQTEILNKITYEFSYMEHIAVIAQKLNLPSKKHTLALFKTIKAEAICMAMQIQNREPSTFRNPYPLDTKVRIWNIIDILRDVARNKQYQYNIDVVLSDKIVDHIIKLNNICADRMGTLHSGINVFIWIFLETLGFMTLFAIMMVDAQSKTMEIAICHITILSVSMLCYVLADIDSPFNGFFRVDLQILVHVINKLERTYFGIKSLQDEEDMAKLMEQGMRTRRKTKHRADSVEDLEDPDHLDGMELRRLSVASRFTNTETGETQLHSPFADEGGDERY